MHPAFSVVFLTTLIGVGQGLFLALYTCQLYSVIKVLPAQDSASFYGYGSLLAVFFLVFGWRMQQAMGDLFESLVAEERAAQQKANEVSHIVLPSHVDCCYGLLRYYRVLGGVRQVNFGMWARYRQDLHSTCRQNFRIE